jgi:hypothetical protein
MKSDEVLACPKCRSKATVNFVDGHGFLICCTNLDKVADNMYKTQKEAITAWNNEIIAMRKQPNKKNARRISRLKK